MKKNLPLILALVLALVAAWFVLGRRDSTLSKEELEFAVKDTGKVNRIFLADRLGNTVRLDRKSLDTWLVNDSFPARADLLKSLLEAVSRIQVKTRVPKAGFNNVMKALASDGIKCEIYLDPEDEPVSVYYIGGPTADQLGTFMMKENGELPFIGEIPGFNGYLTPRYTPKSNEWKDKLIFAYAADDIREIKLNYPSRPEWSFTLLRTAGGFLLGDPANAAVSLESDTTAVSNYLFLFRKVAFETVASRMRKEEQDSLAAQTAIAEMTVTDIQGKTRGLRLYPMPVQVGSIATQDSLGQPLKQDVDRFYANDPEQSAWWILQHFTFDPLLRKRSDFIPTEKK